MRHWNEDPHSTPAPINYARPAITSTQARFYKEGSDLNRKAELPKGNLPGWYFSTGTFDGAYNAGSTEYNSVGVGNSLVQLDSDL